MKIMKNCSKILQYTTPKTQEVNWTYIRRMYVQFTFCVYEETTKIFERICLLLLSAQLVLRFEISYSPNVNSRFTVK